MKTTAFITLLCVAVAFTACASNSKLHRSSRPETILVREDASFTMPWNRTSDVRIPAGEYRYAWEDKGYWYFDHPSALITAHIKGRIPVTRTGGFAIAKDYDEIGLFLYCEWDDMYKRGVGDAVIAMMPKHSGKIVSWEGDIPKEKESIFKLVGEVPR